MKLPNNYGSISKLSGNRRRPYIVRKSIGVKQYVVGYYESYEIALQALADYNRQKATETPITAPTLATLYAQWLPQHAENISISAVNGYKNAYRDLYSIAGVPLSRLKFDDFQAVINDMAGLSYASKKKVRSLINQLFKFALKKELVSRNYGELLTLGKNKTIRPHKPFTRQQINKLWRLNSHDADGALVLLYTGMRCGELLNLRRRDVNLKTKILTVTKSKTAAGAGRIIPIHHRIYDIIKRRCESTTELLFDETYNHFATNFKRVTEYKHTTHDARHTVASLLDSAGANPTATRAILGHKNGDITIKVYTHKTACDLRRAIELLK